MQRLLRITSSQNNQGYLLTLVGYDINIHLFLETDFLELFRVLTNYYLQTVTPLSIATPFYTAFAKYIIDIKKSEQVSTRRNLLADIRKLSIKIVFEEEKNLINFSSPTQKLFVPFETQAIEILLRDLIGIYISHAFYSHYMSYMLYSAARGKQVDSFYDSFLNEYIHKEVLFK